MSKRGVCAYSGKMLRIDLTGGAVAAEPTAKYARDWLGGSGIGQWLLYSEVKPQVGPYDPANLLSFGAGPLVGTLAPGACRLSADSVSPLTLGVGSSSCDSHFALELKFAGFDQIVLKGKAPRPVYLWIEDGRAEIRDAAHLWGKTTWETVDLIRQEMGADVHLVSIGPAGENLVRAACIMQDKGRALGRCGLGAVMGSKNLKAVAARGSGAVEIARPERFMQAVDEARRGFAVNPASPNLSRVGTIGALAWKQAHSGMPARNFQYLTMPEDEFRRLDPDDIQRDYWVRNVGYAGCPVPCSRYYRIDRGPYAGLGAEGFQFHTVTDFGSKLGVAEPDFLIKVNACCNQLGIDVEGLAGPVAWAMECYQRGILNQGDTDGLRLEWGDAGVVLELARRIAYREGFGDLLAEGSARAAQRLGRGSGYYAMHMKGQDLYESLRGDIGWALGCCTATRGGGHTTGTPRHRAMENADAGTRQRVYGLTSFSDVPDYEGKAEQVFYFDRLHRVANSLGICHFCTSWAGAVLPGFPELAELYSAATGWETSGDDLKRAGARILNVEKAFNVLHAGFDRKDDYPTPRDMAEPIPDGSMKGWRIDRARWDNLLDEYYRLNGWDESSGIPTRECLEALDLPQVAADLAAAGRLATA